MYGGAVDRVRRIVVIGGGPVGDPADAAHLGPAHFAPVDLVIAADSGLDRAQSLGWPVDIVIGDFDSVSAPGLATIDAATTLERHPADKDQTDLELALDRAAARGATHIDVLAGSGGRIDHTLAIWLILASDRYHSIEVTAHAGPDIVSVVVAGRPRRLGGRSGDVVSLLPVHGPAIGVTTDGLRFPLRCETLPAGSGRGVSNLLVGTEAVVSLEQGTLLAVQPH